MEGFAGGEGLLTASRIKAAGRTLRYVAFDEPFYYATLYAGPNACRWDAHRVAQAVAAYIRGIRTVFPNVKFGDTEPLTTAADVEPYKECSAPEPLVDHCCLFCDVRSADFDVSPTSREHLTA